MNYGEAGFSKSTSLGCLVHMLMRLKPDKWKTCFRIPLLNAGMTAICPYDWNYTFIRSPLYRSWTTIHRESGQYILINCFLININIIRPLYYMTTATFIILTPLKKVNFVLDASNVYTALNRVLVVSEHFFCFSQWSARHVGLTFYRKAPSSFN